MRSRGKREEKPCVGRVGWKKSDPTPQRGEGADPALEGEGCKRPKRVDLRLLRKMPPIAGREGEGRGGRTQIVSSEGKEKGRRIHPNSRKKNVLCKDILLRKKTPPAMPKKKGLPFAAKRSWAP